MPVLANPRHELFAQELAKGKSAREAYESAGFRSNRGNATTLKRQESISSRVAEIQQMAAEMTREATQMAAQRLSVDREWVLARLQENALKAAKSGDFGPSNRALELIGKEIAGMFVDRSEVTQTVRDITDEPLSNDEWAERHVTSH